MTKIAFDPQPGVVMVKHVNGNLDLLLSNALLLRSAAVGF